MYQPRIARNFFVYSPAISVFVEVIRHVKACRDPKDDKFLELAANGEADYLITGDKDLLELAPFEGIPVITPKEFLDLTL